MIEDVGKRAEGKSVVDVDDEGSCGYEGKGIYVFEEGGVPRLEVCSWK